MSATVYAVIDEEGIALVGAACDACQEAVIAFDAVAFGSDYLAKVIEIHDCRGDDDE